MPRSPQREKNKSLFELDLESDDAFDYSTFQYRFTSADIDIMMMKFDALQKALAEYGMLLIRA